MYLSMSKDLFSTFNKQYELYVYNIPSLNLRYQDNELSKYRRDISSLNIA